MSSMPAPPQTPRPLPVRLSPSRAKDFLQCPQLFYYKTILGLPTPSSIPMAKGTLAHTAFERLFDHTKEERRDPATALAYVEPGWEVMVNPFAQRDDVAPDSPEARIRNKEHLWVGELDEESWEFAQAHSRAAEYRALMAKGSPEEAKFLIDTAKIVENYFSIERPWNFDPEARELHLEAESLGVTLHGFIDRLDRYTTSTGEERWVISDYKTGKVHQPRFADDAFFQLKVYAVLLKLVEGVTAHKLRLLYVSAQQPDAVQELLVDDAILESTQRKMVQIWNEMKASKAEDMWEAKKGPLCNWCHFKPQCPAFTSSKR